MGEAVRLAVIGVGVHGARHAEIFCRMPGVDLVGVADVNEATARDVAERCATRAAADFRELLDQVEAVSIAVPANKHFEVAHACLERGIHVFL